MSFQLGFVHELYAKAMSTAWMHIDPTKSYAVAASAFVASMTVVYLMERILFPITEMCPTVTKWICIAFPFFAFYEFQRARGFVHMFVLIAAQSIASWAINGRKRTASQPTRQLPLYLFVHHVMFMFAKLMIELDAFRIDLFPWHLTLGSQIIIANSTLIYLVHWLPHDHVTGKIWLVRKT